MNYSPFEKVNYNKKSKSKNKKSKSKSKSKKNKSKKNKSKKSESKKSENDCYYNERNFKLNSKKCAQENKQINYILNNFDEKKCKLLNNNRIENKLISNKNNKQLNTRLIKTIPYRNPKIFDYNPEYELIVQSGLYNSNRKSTGNTGEIEQDLPPMINKIKMNIDNKVNNFDISRFQLSSRNLKGNKAYINNYKTNLNLIKSSLNKN